MITVKSLCELFKSPCKLVRAARPTPLAIDPPEPGDGILHLHPRTERSHSLGIAVAPSCEEYPADHAVSDFDVNLGGANQAAGLERGRAHASLGGVDDLYDIKNVHGGYSSIKSAFASGVI